MPTKAPLSKEDAFLLDVSTIARKCGRQFVHAADADDIAQDIVLYYLEAFRENRPVVVRKDLSGMVRNMVVWRILDTYRATRRRARRDAQYLATLTGVTPAWMCPELQMEEGELTALVTRTLDALTPMCRTVYLMVRDDDESYLSAASTLGITRSSVCNHVVVAQRRLRVALAGWLEDRFARVSAGRAQLAETDAKVTVQPVNAAA